MKSLAVSELVPHSYLSGLVYLDQDYLLLSPEIPVSPDLIKALNEWGIAELQAEEGAEVKKLLDDSADGDVTASFGVEDTREGAYRQETAKFYVGMLEFTHSLFDGFTKRGTLPLDPITDELKTLMTMMRSHRRYLLRLGELDRSGFPYLVCHSVNTAILCVALGETLKLPGHRTLELGMAGLLHEIGMFRLPENFQNANRQLTPEEKRALLAHPLLGFRVLKEKNFPPNVCMAVLEHHEREDGTGYPQGIKGEKISLAAKILNVTSSYDAQISPRPYREARNGYMTLLDMLKESTRMYDDGVIKKLIFTLSLYPIGSIVELNTGALAMVHDSQSEAPKRPDVRILTDISKQPLAEPLLVKLVERNEMNIVKVLNPSEVKSLRAQKILGG